MKDEERQQGGCNNEKKNSELQKLISVVKNVDMGSASYLIRLKEIMKFAGRSQVINQMINECLNNMPSGNSIQTGHIDLEDYRITAIYSCRGGVVKKAMVFKFFSTFGYIQNQPGTLRSFTINLLNHRVKQQTSFMELSFLGNFGREFSVKINFFTYN